MSYRPQPFLALCFFLVPLAAPAAGPVAASSATGFDERIERIYGDKHELDGRPFGPVKWLGDGAAYTTLEPAAKAGDGKDAKDAKAAPRKEPEKRPAAAQEKPGKDEKEPEGGARGPRDSAREIVRYDAESGKREVLVTLAQLTPVRPDAKPLAISDYSWSKDQRWLLVFTNSQRVWRQRTRGDYWLLDRSTGKLRQLGGSAAAPATLMFAKLSPDATRVAYVREKNLYAEEVGSGEIVQLTTDGSATVHNGLGDWANEEELGIRDAFRWSDDGKLLAYWQFDTTGVRDFLMLNDTAGLYPALTQFPYPKVGTQNSAVRVGVVPAAGGKTRWLDLPGEPRDRYVPRLYWMKDAQELAVFQLNRAQNQLDVFVADAATGKVELLLQDADKAWVSVREEPRWTRDGRTLLFLSDRDGWQHAYAVSRADKKVRLLTPQPADVIALVGTDGKDEWLHYVASPESAVQRHLYRVKLDGSGTAERLTPASQPGTHGHSLSPDGRFAIHTYSTFSLPPSTDLVRLPSHEVVRTLQDNHELREKVAPLLRPPEFFTVDLGEGVKLDGWMLKPSDFDAKKKYPLILFVYGEPASTTVNDAWRGGLVNSALAELGYVVLSLDSRGAPAPKGREWRKSVHGAVNKLTVQDQTAAVKKLLEQRPYLDPARVGVYGHSGGGTNTLNLLFRSPDTFQVGVASAPVVDMRYYDTIYQERYMGLYEPNMEAYRVNSPLAHAEGLRGKLLLIHGGADDNVHFQNSEVLVNRLVELQKQFDLMVYPNGSHAISEGKGYAVHRVRLMGRYFQTHLPPGGR
jgi:dipeptidyl-peptidase-4